MKPRSLAPPALACLLAAAPAVAEEPIDWEAVNRLRDEGFNCSQVMRTLEHLTDVIGPRLTGSPAAKVANEWTRDKLTEWGLENARLLPLPRGDAGRALPPRADATGAAGPGGDRGRRGGRRGSAAYGAARGAPQ